MSFNAAIKWLWLGLGVLLWANPAAAQTITVDGSQTFQTINGFGANINHRSWNTNELQPVLDSLISQGGMTIFRVVFDNTDWETTNDNNDSSTPNWNYYNQIYGSARFEKLWDTVAYLNQKGITNGVMLNFQGPGPEWLGGTSLTPGYEDEWAEMIATLVIYARNTRHLQFNLIGPDNEPDVEYNGVDVSGYSQYVTMLHLLAQKLNTNGLGDIQFVGPDMAFANNATTYIPQMMNDPLVMSKLAHFGLHSYSGGGTGSAGVQQLISHSSYPNSTFWMTEFNAVCTNCLYSQYGTYDWAYCSATAENLLYHLANGATAGLAWEGYDSYYELLPLKTNNSYQAAGWSMWGLFGVDNTNAAPKTYTARKNFYTLAQIAKFVPPGAQRIGVSGGANGSFMALAFYHAASGRLTVAGFNNDQATTLSGTLLSLPPVANLDLYYTDNNTNLAHATNVAVSNGSFSVNIPAACIFTLTGFNPTNIAVTASLTNPTTGTYYTAPATIPLQAAATTTNGAIAGVKFLNGTNTLGQSASAPYGLVLSNAAPGSYLFSASATDSAGEVGVSPLIGVTVAGPPVQLNLTPSNVTLVPFGTQPFAASIVDALGTVISPQPSVTWSVNGGGSISANGFYWAGNGTGGPFTITASNNGLGATASVTISNNVNLAPAGIAYTWYNLVTPTQTSPQYEAPGINDGDLLTGMPLLPCCQTAGDNPNAYEAAGIVWPAPQTISSVVFINGASTDNSYGFFAAGFQFQFSFDGVNWTPAGPQWTVSPAYSYNSTVSSGVSYTFSGSLASVRGVRCVGQVNTTGGSSIIAVANEVQAYQGAPPPLQATSGTNRLNLSWAGPLTNAILQTTTNLTSSTSWSVVTNAQVQTNGMQNVTVTPAHSPQFFRLLYP